MKVDLTSRLDISNQAKLRLATDQTAASLARPIAPLSIATSIPRAIETLRQSNLDSYPVVSGNQLVLLLSEADLSSILLSMTPEEQERHRLLRLVDVVNIILERRIPTPRVMVDEPISAALSLFQIHPYQSVIAVVDRQGGYYGVLSRSDLLASSFRTLAPARVGGMATPLGVYLTDGIDYGGVGNVALMLAGASMTLLFVIAAAGAGWVQDEAVAHHLDITGPIIKLLLPIMPTYAAAFVGDMQVLIPLVLMLALLRTIPVAGYHAAEHQVVHCIERGEPLLPDNVASMPRPHPRCGTNLVAGLSLFGFYFSVFAGLLQSYSGAVIPAAIVTLLTWRQVGTFLQQYFTTRKASSKQIASGIAAGEALLQKFRQNTNRKVKLPMRIWRMGIIQMFAGCGAMGLLLWGLSYAFPPIRPFLQGLN